MGVQISDKLGLATSCEGGYLIGIRLCNLEGSEESLTATRYHLSLPSVLDGNFCSSFSNNNLAPSAVGSSEELILTVWFMRVRHELRRRGLVENTGL